MSEPAAAEARPALDPPLAALLSRVWPALPAAAARAAALGFTWSEVSTPFVRWAGARALAHVGLIEHPLVVDGRPVRVGSVHAVCTDPEARGRGHCRVLLEQALAFADQRYATLLLTTRIPDLYAKFGFRPLREHAFVREHRPGRKPAGPVRALSLEVADDVRLLRRLVARRAPVSDRLASLEEGTMLMVSLLLTPGGVDRLHYHDDLDAVTVHERRGRTLVLHEVIAARIPPLDALTAGMDVDRVVALFPPDRLSRGFRAEAWDRARARAHGDDEHATLMARGPFVRTGPFMLQPLSRT